MVMSRSRATASIKPAERSPFPTWSSTVTRRRIASIYDIPDEMMDEPAEVLEPCALTMPVVEQDIESEIRMLTTTISAEAIRRGADSEGVDLYMARRHNRFIERLQEVGYVVTQEPHVAHHDTFGGGAVIVLSVCVVPGGETEVDKQAREDCDPAVNHGEFRPRPWDGHYE